MANSFLQIFCFIVLTIFVERGDGRWKNKDGNLQHDIELFRKMADKIDHELEDTYDEYSSRRLKQQIFDSLQQKYRRNTGEKAKNYTKYEVKSYEPYVSSINYKNIVQKNAISNHNDEVTSSSDVISITNNQSSILDKSKASKWPKFEDILLKVGKKYDWKNDRWIKVKEKLKSTDVDNNSNNSIEFHEKHNFHYRIVKLNKSKKRRKVVVAVSAVR